MAKKELGEMSDKEIREELKRRRQTDREFRVEKGKKDGVVVVWPPSRSRFPLSAQAMTWLEVLDHEEEIRAFCADILQADAGSSPSSKKPKKKKGKKKGKRKKCFGEFDKDSGACEYCKHAVACQDETEG